MYFKHKCKIQSDAVTHVIDSYAMSHGVNIVNDVKTQGKTTNTGKMLVKLNFEWIIFDCLHFCAVGKLARKA